MATRYIQGSPVDYQGRTDGVAVPAGYIGETIVVNCGAATASGVNSVATICSYSLPAGNWSVHAFDSFYNLGRGTGGHLGGADLYDGASVIADGRYKSSWGATASTNDTESFGVELSAVLSFTGANKTISFRVRTDSPSGGTGSPSTTSRGFGKMIFTRIG